MLSSMAVQDNGDKEMFNVYLDLVLKTSLVPWLKQIKYVLFS